MSKRLVVALSGGVGGAKLALGLSLVLPADELLVVANTGDDFEHLGLSISPDIDTLTYALAGIDNPATGWGRRDETWSFMDSIGALGGEDWFRLGDRDLALHVERTRRLRLGQTLSEVTTDICRRLGIGARIILGKMTQSQGCGPGDSASAANPHVPDTFGRLPDRECTIHPCQYSPRVLYIFPPRKKAITI